MDRRRAWRSRSCSSAAQASGTTCTCRAASRDIRGSSTEEFTPTEPPPTDPAAAAEEAPGFRRADAGRLADLRLRPATAALPPEPAGAAVPGPVDVPGAPPARVPARGRLRPCVHREQPGRALRRPGCDRADELALHVGPLRRRLAGRRGRGRLHGVPQPAPAGARRLQRAAGHAGARRRGRRPRRADGEGRLAPPDRAERDVAARRGRPRLRRRLDGPGLRALGEDGPRGVGLPDRRTGERSGRAHRAPPLRRLLRPPPLRDRRAQRPPDLARLLAGPARRPRHVLLDARRPRTGASTSARPTARSTRSARRAASCAGRSPPAATSTARRPCGTS